MGCKFIGIGNVTEPGAAGHLAVFMIEVSTESEMVPMCTSRNFDGLTWNDPDGNDLNLSPLIRQPTTLTTEPITHLMLTVTFK